MSEEHQHCTAGDRFDRVESWLEKLAEQMEKVTELMIESRMNRQTIDDHENRIRSLEKVTTRNDVLGKWIERLIWLFIAGFFYFLKTKGGI